MRQPGHGLILGLFIGIFVFVKINNMIGLFVMKISSDAESLLKKLVFKKIK